jgi:hypothetical protein
MDLSSGGVKPTRNVSLCHFVYRKSQMDCLGSDTEWQLMSCTVTPADQVSHVMFINSYHSGMCLHEAEALTVAKT